MVSFSVERSQKQESIIFPAARPFDKPTSTPTMSSMRWIFQSIRWVCLNGIRQVASLDLEHQRILSLLGSHCQKYYFLG